MENSSSKYGAAKKCCKETHWKTDKKEGNCSISLPPKGVDGSFLSTSTSSLPVLALRWSNTGFCLPLTVHPSYTDDFKNGHEEQAGATGSIVIKELEDIHPTLGRAKRAARRGGEGERGKESGTGQELQPEQETSSASSPELQAPPSNWGMV